MSTRRSFSVGFQAWKQLLGREWQHGQLFSGATRQRILVPSVSCGSAIRRYAVKPRPAKNDEPQDMFCYQCEQTKNRRGCTAIGVCGKTPDVAALQDLLVYVVKGLSMYANRARKMGIVIEVEIYDFIFGALFSTLTNVNFDEDRFPEYISQAVKYRDQLKSKYLDACDGAQVAPEVFSQGPAHWRPLEENYEVTQLVEEGKTIGVLPDKLIYGDDILGVRQMIIYGLKGMSTYARHAMLVGQRDTSIGDFVFEVLDWLMTGPENERHDLTQALGWALKVGEFNLKGLELLDKGHCEQFGNPSPTEVQLTPVHGKCILVSGHDMHDLDLILKLTEGTGINVYTHGEMLPAHGYPGLRKYKHLAGHYGGAWQLQRFEFPMFPGAIVITTNCVTEPMKAYKDRLFTLNETGWPGVRHLKNLESEFQPVIEKALQMEGFPKSRPQETKTKKTLTVGFGHHAIVSNAEKVIGAVKSGELKRVFVVGGCDGAENKRTYFSRLVDLLPSDTLVLTMGCAKYRFNQHEFGELGTTGLPRLMDVGQCNDSYGAVVVATELAKAFNTDINSLPLSINLSWFEQKAVAVLLSLLHLGIKDIRLGPVLPAFITPTVLGILKEKYNLMPVDVRRPEDDLEMMMSGK